MNKGCKVENCMSKHKARGFCNSHYVTELRHETGVYLTRRLPRMTTCQMPDCEIKLSKKGLCGAHYYATHVKPKYVAKRHKKPVENKQSSLPCRNCGAPSFSNNMCQLHYNEFKLSPNYTEGLWQFVKKELNLV